MKITIECAKTKNFQKHTVAFEDEFEGDNVAKKTREMQDLAREMVLEQISLDDLGK